VAAEAAEPAPRQGTIVLASRISSIAPDGLRYRGYAIDDLVAHAAYEDVAWLLWTGEPPTVEERARVSGWIAAGVALPSALWRAAASLPTDAPPVARLQALLPLLALSVPELAEDAPLDGAERAARLLGAFAVLAGSALHPPVTPPAPLGDVATTFLTLARGDAPSSAQAHAFAKVLILYADHELNASTFAGRVAASTQADLVSAVLAALCALRGPLHGGVDRHVRALIAAAEQEGARMVVERYKRAGSYLPGFGHSVYRGIDPRAVIMRDLARQLAPAAGQERLLATVEAIETEAGRRGIPAANVDLYTVPVYRALGIPDALSTLVFATGRMAGWTAHILEQYADNRLIRPRAAYAGPGPRTWPTASR
jgi:citrate synthase